MRTRGLLCGTVFLASSFTAGAASAQASATALAPAAEIDGARFRGGISLSGGGELGPIYQVPMGGIDGRLGVQLNHLIAIYAQPYVSVGYGYFRSADIAGDVLTANGGVPFLVDFTFLNRLFVAAGGGAGFVHGILSGLLHFRAGGYLVSVRGDNGIRRKGLMMGVDVRTYFLAVGTSAVVVQPMLGIGYEAF